MMPPSEPATSSVFAARGALQETGALPMNQDRPQVGRGAVPLSRHGEGDRRPSARRFAPVHAHQTRTGSARAPAGSRSRMIVLAPWLGV
jgi:hypothetical protein